MDQIEKIRPGNRADAGPDPEGFNTPAREVGRQTARRGGGLKRGQDITMASAIVEHMVEEIENCLRGIG